MRTFKFMAWVHLGRNSSLKRGLGGFFFVFRKCIFYILPALIMVGEYSFSQSKKTDSLLVLLTNTTISDTAKAQLLIELAWEYKFSNHDSALKYGETSLASAKKLNWKMGIIKSNYTLGRIYLDLDQFPKAIENFQHAATLSDSLGELNQKMKAEQWLSQLYELLGKTPFAFEHFKQYVYTRDSILDHEKAKKQSRIETKHEYEKQQLINEQKEKEQFQKMQEAISRRNNLQYSGIIIALLVICLGMAFFVKTKISGGFVKGLVFFFFLLFFEFLLVFLDPFIEKITQGEPLFKLLINTGIAAIIFPFHSFLENFLKKRLLTQLPKFIHESKPTGIINLLLPILWLGILVLHSGFLDKTDSLKIKLDSLKQLPKTFSRDTHIVNALNTLAFQLCYVNPDSTLLLAKEAMKISREINFIKGEEGAYNNRGVGYTLQGDYPNAITNYLRAVEIGKKIGDKEGIGLGLGNLGLIYMHQGDYPKALKNIFKASRIFEELGDKKRVAMQFSNLGGIYYRQGDLSKALNYLFKALEIQKSLGRKIGISRNQNNIGIIYCDQGNFTQSLEYHFASLKMDIEMDNKIDIATGYGNIGNVYQYQGDSASSKGNITLAKTKFYPKAMEYYIEAMRVEEITGNKAGICRHLGNLGVLYDKTERYIEAEKYIKNSLALADSMGSLWDIMENHQHLSHLYDTLSNRLTKGNRMEGFSNPDSLIKLAFSHYKKYREVKYNLFNDENSREIGKLEMNHEMEMAELKHQQEETEKKRIAEASINRRNKLEYTGIFTGIFLLFILIFFLGKLKFPVWAMELWVFVSFLIFFEFVLVLIDPFSERITGGEPLYKLIINVCFALMIFPVHGFLERVLKKRIFKTRKSP